MQPVLGRTIQPSDVGADGQPAPVIVLTDNAWRRLFDGRADALGQKLVLNDQPYTVIGVMPSRFGWWNDQGGWIAMKLDPREERRIFPIVRLASGVAPQAAENSYRRCSIRRLGDPAAAVEGERCRRRSRACPSGRGGARCRRARRDPRSRRRRARRRRGRASRRGAGAG